MSAMRDFAGGDCTNPRNPVQTDSHPGTVARRASEGLMLPVLSKPSTAGIAVADKGPGRDVSPQTTPSLARRGVSVESGDDEPVVVDGQAGDCRQRDVGRRQPSQALVQAAMLTGRGRQGHSLERQNQCGGPQQ